MREVDAELDALVERKARELNAGLYARAERQDRLVREAREDANRSYERMLARQRLVARLEHLHDARIAGAFADVAMTVSLGLGLLLLTADGLLQEAHPAASLACTTGGAAMAGAAVVFGIINLRSLRRYRKRFYLARLEAARLARVDAAEQVTPRGH